MKIESHLTQVSRNARVSRDWGRWILHRILGLTFVIAAIGLAGSFNIRLQNQSADRLTSRAIQSPAHLAAGRARATPDCDLWSSTEVESNVDDRLQEFSGMEISENHFGRTYSINDSGNTSILFVANSGNRNVEEIDLPGGLLDTEDLSLGPCPTSGSCLYIADIGDNFQIRPVKTIVFKPEEELENQNFPFERIRFRYQWDLRLDAETLMVHPISGSIYIVTKGRSSYIFKIDSSALEDTASIHTAEYVAKLDHTGIAAGDFHPSGEMFVVSNRRLYEYYVDLDALEGSDHPFVYFEDYRLVPTMRDTVKEAAAYAVDSIGIVYGSEGSSDFSRGGKIGRTKCERPASFERGLSPFAVVIEAEDGHLRGALRIIESNDRRIAISADTLPETLEEYSPESGSAVYEFQIDEDGIYYIFGLVNSPSDINNSFHMKVDDQPVDIWETPPTTGWVWSRANKNNGTGDASFYLKRGNHTLELGAREPGTALDKLVISNDPSYPVR